MVVLSTLAFVWLFYHQLLGINLILFEVFVLAFIVLVQKERFKSLQSKIVLAGTLLSGIFTVIHFSILAYFVNISSFLLLAGVMAASHLNSIPHFIAQGFSNFFQSIGAFFELLGNGSTGNRFLRILFNVVKIGLVPIIILFLFVLMYKASNPVFEKYVMSVNDWLVEHLGKFFENISWSLFFMILWGLLVSIVYLVRVPNPWIIREWEKLKLTHQRKHRQPGLINYKFTALKQEYKAGIFLFAMLNALLLFVNIIDVNLVWISFEWNGEYLKQFVHQGTYLLIFSILISIALVLYFFRGNLSFYKKNRFLRILSITWIIQNTVLVLSVAMRNLHYIHYFSLAYKRIGVFFFLILTIYGLYLVSKKVLKNKTIYFVINRSMLAGFSLFAISTFFNWDSIIARYNFAHYKESFVHLNFISSLSDKTLPLLDKSLDELMAIKAVQDEKFPFEHKYMGPEEYKEEIERRKIEFKTKWENKNFRSWNLAEQKAYKELFGK